MAGKKRKSLPRSPDGCSASHRNGQRMSRDSLSRNRLPNPESRPGRDKCLVTDSAVHFQVNHYNHLINLFKRWTTSACSFPAWRTLRKRYTSTGHNKAYPALRGRNGPW
jgi:hypothetical protein